MELGTGHFPWWIRGQCRLWWTDPRMGTQRQDYSISSSLPNAYKFQHSSCNDYGRLYHVWSVSWRRQQWYVQGFCRKSTPSSLQPISGAQFSNCHGQCFYPPKQRISKYVYWLTIAFEGRYRSYGGQTRVLTTIFPGLQPYRILVLRTQKTAQKQGLLIESHWRRSFCICWSNYSSCKGLSDSRNS